MLDVNIRHVPAYKKERYGLSETRLASLIRFKEGVDERQLELALRSIAHVLDGPVEVQEYAPEHGEPCFYIP